MIPYGRQHITQADVDAVVRVLQSDFLTQGMAVPHFEEGVAKKMRAAHAVAVNSATSALHVACLALGLGPGDILWTVPNTFVASANCGRYCGADVDFVDIDPVTWNVSISRLREKLLQAKRENRLPKVLVPVHFSGQPTEQEAVWELAQQYGFRVIEDASHAIGASRNGEPVGSCRWSDICIFSFHPVKIITSGEGGMALTNDSDLADSMIMLRSHGITRSPEKVIGNGQPSQASAFRAPWYYEQQRLGFNYRMTDIHAALGASQLGRLDSYVERRNVLARQYDEALRDFALQRPYVSPENRSSFHLYVIRVPDGEVSRARDELFDQLRNSGIGVNVHYQPVHLQPYYRNLGFTEGQFPEAEAFGKSAITLPLYPEMSEQQFAQVVKALEAAF